MSDISWILVAIFAGSGVGMALLSCLVGLKPKVENPLWWALYAAWIAATLLSDSVSIFYTLLIGSVLAGLLHGVTTSLLFDAYIANNPWHAQEMGGPKSKYVGRFISTGIVVGALFGAIVAGIGWGISRL